MNVPASLAHRSTPGTRALSGALSRGGTAAAAGMLAICLALNPTTAAREPSPSPTREVTAPGKRGSTTPAAQEPTSATQRNLLTGRYSLADLQTCLLPATEWHPFPKAGDDAGWAAIPPAVRAAHLARAETLLGCEWPALPASVFLEFVRTGNRTNFQQLSYQRRGQLAALVLGECIEGQGRFLDDIMNGIWTICEETYWGVPAHVSLQRRGAGLPDVAEPTVDLFVAETGMLLAWTHYLVGEELAAISPLVPERIEREVERRILSVCLERDDFWWMGYDGRTVNNWNPWVCSNWLTCVLLLEDDPGRRSAGAHKIMQCLDHFLNPYPADGGCDEGPGYWSRAGGSLFDCLELFASASAGEIDIFDEPLIAEIGRYITRAWIADRWFINFADAAARLSPDASLIYRYGRNIGDVTMTGFGALLAERQGLGEGTVSGGHGVLGRVLPTLFSLHELLAAEPQAPLIRNVWLPELEVMSARSETGSTRGLYLAAKGGHNNESHNHNDVGTFIVYCDGEPALIDVGVETYTARTFSSERYSIWTMQSAWHNLPTINGCMQQAGGSFRAREVTLQSSSRRVRFELELAGAWPETAGVRSYRRSLTLQRGRSVELRDSWQLTGIGTPLELNLMTCREPVAAGPGRVHLPPPGSGEGVRGVEISWAADTFTLSMDEVELTDSRLRSSWGNRVWRLRLIHIDTPAQGEALITIRPLPRR